MSLETAKGIQLDIGCGEKKQKGWVGIDARPCEGVDIVHDLQVFPWPLPDSVALRALCSHLWEHIEPKYRIRFMDEIWRVMKPEGQLLLSAPYWTSFGAFQDPTHYPCPNEATFTYFDSSQPLYEIYKPKPWKIIVNNYQYNGNLEVVLEARKDNHRCEQVEVPTKAQASNRNSHARDNKSGVGPSKVRAGHTA